MAKAYPTVADETRDQQVRLAAFSFLADQVALRGDTLPWALLSAGFEFEGERVPLVGPQGIFKPRLMTMPLSITTAPAVQGRERPYSDAIEPDGRLAYRYRGSDATHPDNAGLRRAMARHTPLVYFHGIVKGEYLVRWPVFVEADDPAALTFRVAIDSPDAQWPAEAGDGSSLAGEDRRRYITVTTQHRIHQEEFRRLVLRAYRESCAVCRLRHEKLLDAAHILSDKHPKGRPVVSNGLALCKLHHAAFDTNILGVRPDLVIEIREDILREVDGPMLTHGLQGFQGQPIRVPRAAALRPDRELLEERYELFRRAS